jgi:hypothetical protein
MHWYFMALSSLPFRARQVQGPPRPHLLSGQYQIASSPRCSPRSILLKKPQDHSTPSYMQSLDHHKNVGLSASWKSFQDSFASRGDHLCSIGTVICTLPPSISLLFKREGELCSEPSDHNDQRCQGQDEQEIHEPLRGHGIQQIGPGHPPRESNETDHKQGQ